MHIELLWIVPIAAFAFLLFLIAFYAQRHSPGPDKMTREVNQYNAGQYVNQHLEASRESDRRLNELESAITLLAQSIGGQQKVIDRFQSDKNLSSHETDELKKQLRSLYKEHDIILSENYSLRAKVKKLLGETPTVESESALKANSVKANLKLYDDTRVMGINNLEDTSLMDLSDFKQSES